MREIPRRKAIGIEVAAMAAWVNLPSLLALTAAPAHDSAFNREWALVNLNDAIALLAVILPTLFVLWSSGDPWTTFGVRRWKGVSDLLWTVGMATIGLILYAPIQIGVPGLAGPGKPQGVAVGVSILLLAVAVGVWEELFFRGYLIARLEELTGKTWAAVVAAATLFSIGHFTQGPFGGLAAFLFGILFGTAFAMRRRLWPLVFAHTVVNVALCYLF